MSTGRVDSKIADRFSQLTEAGAKIAIGQNNGWAKSPGEWAEWSSATESLLVGVFGADGIHTKNFQKILGETHSVEKGRGVLRAARFEYEGEYELNLRTTISGEVLGSLAGLARKALDEGSESVAAVLAAAAAEDALKRFAERHQIDVEGKLIEDVIHSLKAAGLVSGTLKQFLKGLPDFRNAALHAEWKKVSDTAYRLAFIETFLAKNF